MPREETGEEQNSTCNDWDILYNYQDIFSHLYFLLFNINGSSKPFFKNLDLWPQNPIFILRFILGLCLFMYIYSEKLIELIQ